MMWRHGDVIIAAVDEVPQGARKLPTAVLAHGEITGYSHRIEEPGWEQALHPRPCTNQTCGCHIGYVHMDDLKLYDRFGEGVLERIPAQSM